MNVYHSKTLSKFTVCLTLLVIAMVTSPHAEAQRPSERRSSRSVTREDSKLLSLFESIASSASESTVKIETGTRHRQIAVGTIIDESGLILTKASEMRGIISCRLPDGEVKPATVEAIDTENDLALLKVCLLYTSDAADE